MLSTDLLNLPHTTVLTSVYTVTNRPTESTTHYSADISIHSNQEPCLGILEKKKKGGACTVSELPLLFLLSII